MKRACLNAAECPVARSLEAVGDWWSLLIVRDAFFGKRRFGEFQRSLGVARNILTVRLKKLVAHGILEQVPAADGSAYKEYALTEKARGLYLVVVALMQWSRQDGDDRALVERATGKPVRPLALLSHDGRELGPEEVELVAPKPAKRGR
jgi:DNA-binding HxlR family transcriptional regulator